MSMREKVYLVLAVLGATVPWYFNLQFMATGQGGAAFVSALWVNAATSSFTVDLGIACIAFVVWLFAETDRLGMRYPWLYVALTFVVAFACAFPLFLLMRERALPLPIRAT